MSSTTSIPSRTPPSRFPLRNRGALPPGIVEAACLAADAAGAAIRPHFRASLAPELKADLSPVTIADRAAERVMRTSLAAAFPEHGLYGEEEGPEREGSPYLWLLDPIDGTRAFITGRPIFGSLIALLHEGEPILGLIDQPITGERWLGLQGKQTHFRGRFGGAAGTRPCPALAGAELSCTAPEILGEYAPRFRRLAAATARTSWGGDCYAYGLLALGCIDVIAECGLKPWDWAALVPVIEGAGGRITDWSGRPLATQGDGTVLAVGDPALLEPALALLAP